ncbi:MAG: ribosome biogenesis GTPase Der [Chitinivibrionales bacterium]
MPEKPVVAIVGRPNVGKSSLFNRVVAKKSAVVTDEPGVTRDRNYMETSWNNSRFVLIDTGGVSESPENRIEEMITVQVNLAVKEASAVIFIVDAQTGPLSDDLYWASKLRKTCYDKVVVAVNKAENTSSEQEYTASFQRLGFEDVFCVAAIHGTGIGDMLDCVVSKLPGSDGGDESVSDEINIAVLGCPNAGKSTLVNRFLGEERMIVDSVPGTTRDAIDSEVQYKGRSFRIIDTAGLRRKTKVRKGIEKYSGQRSIESIRRADICVFMIDSEKGFSEQDMRIVHLVKKERKGIVLCWNKWDAVEADTDTFYSLTEEVKRVYPDLRYDPFLSVSAKNGKRTGKILEKVVSVSERMSKRIPSGDIKERMGYWTTRHAHPYIRSKKVKFFGMRQVETDFPFFRVFCSNPEIVRESYKRYLINRIHQEYDFSGCPVELSFRPPGNVKVYREKHNITAEE